MSMKTLAIAGLAGTMVAGGGLFAGSASAADLLSDVELDVVSAGFQEIGSEFDDFDFDIFDFTQLTVVQNTVTTGASDNTVANSLLGTISFGGLTSANFTFIGSAFSADDDGDYELDFDEMESEIEY